VRKLTSLLGVVLFLSACGGDEGNTFKDGGGEGSNPFNNGDGSNPFGNDGGGSGDSGNCYAPVDMYIMQDRSGSMGTDCNVGDMINSKWCHSVNALAGYFNSQSASGNAAAIQFFRVPNHTSALCGTGAQYNTPLFPTGMPAFATLPTNAFNTVLNGQSPSGLTPTEAAIRGITGFTAGNRRGGRVTIGILVTDGDPTECDTNLMNLSNLLQAHYMATTIRTFVIGMTGATFQNLETIAQGGNGPMHPDAIGGLTDACGNGPGPCRHWNVGDGDPKAFIAALAAIQDISDGCKDGGGTVNPN
jgi:hypothetical protein